jgi:outer membrane lipoprotein-sorting protein
MTRKTFAWLLAAGLISATAWAQTADEIIAKHEKAMGGKDKIKAVKTERVTGKMVMGQGMEAPFTMEMARPNKMRMEFTFQGMTGVQAFDGTTGWSVMPFMGKTDPEAAPEEEAKKMQEQANMDGLLMDYKDFGRTVELVGKEDLEGTPVYKLKVTQKSGDIVYLYIDADQYMLLKQAGKTKVRGQEIESETVFGDFKTVDGLVFPHSIEQKMPGGHGGMTMTISKIELNPDVAGSRFTMPPAAEKKPAAPAAEKKPDNPAPPKPPARPMQQQR